MAAPKKRAKKIIKKLICLSEKLPIDEFINGEGYELIQIDKEELTTCLDAVNVEDPKLTDLMNGCNTIIDLVKSIIGDDDHNAYSLYAPEVSVKFRMILNNQLFLYTRVNEVISSVVLETQRAYRVVKTVKI